MNRNSITFYRPTHRLTVDFHSAGASATLIVADDIDTMVCTHASADDVYVTRGEHSALWLNMTHISLDDHEAEVLEIAAELLMGQDND